MKKLMILTGALAALAVCADEVPEVSGVTMAQSGESRLVTVTYTLDKAPAVVTLDIQTNATADTWASIGGENVQSVSGDVWKKVETGTHTITWRPDVSWPDHKIADGGIRAVVTAWSVDNPPDYMVVNLAEDAVTNSATYYPAVEFLPGGLLTNPDYRTTCLVMRKIPAKDVTWTMGSGSTEIGRDSDETTHTVTFTNNYYMAVFETTQAQWALVRTDKPTPSQWTTDGQMRPVERISYNDARSTRYPADPHTGSFVGMLRTKTGFAFDLPSEAQWEFACRAGHGTGYWGNGKPILVSSGIDANLDKLGRYVENAGTNGTAIVGSYLPNSWGLYDMHGNVIEWVLDYYGGNTGLNGAVNTTGDSRKKNVMKGGCYWRPAYYARAAYRFPLKPGECGADTGFRVMLPIK